MLSALEDEATLGQAKVNFARDERWGYVTSCPSNLGSVMRASVNVCLPYLAGKQENRATSSTVSHNQSAEVSERRIHSLLARHASTPCIMAGLSYCPTARCTRGGFLDQCCRQQAEPEPEDSSSVTPVGDLTMMEMAIADNVNDDDAWQRASLTRLESVADPLGLSVSEVADGDGARASAADGIVRDSIV